MTFIDRYGPGFAIRIGRRKQIQLTWRLPFLHKLLSVSTVSYLPLATVETHSNPRPQRLPFL